MAISYGELAYISGLKNKGLRDMYAELDDLKAVKKAKMSKQDVEDYRNAILMEMETRGLPHP